MPSAHPHGGGTTDTVTAPFTAEQVDRLNERQRDVSRHPYTCPVHSDDPLTATPDGWSCSSCGYTQGWALSGDAR